MDWWILILSKAKTLLSSAYGIIMVRILPLQTHCKIRSRCLDRGIANLSFESLELYAGKNGFIFPTVHLRPIPLETPTD